MKTTVEFYNMTEEQLLVMDKYGYTKEEKKLFDEGFISFVSKEGYDAEIEYIKKNTRYELKNSLVTISGKIAIILI